MKDHSSCFALLHSSPAPHSWMMMMCDQNWRASYWYYRLGIIISYTSLHQPFIELCAIPLPPTPHVLQCILSLPFFMFCMFWTKPGFTSKPRIPQNTTHKLRRVCVCVCSVMYLAISHSTAHWIYVIRLSNARINYLEYNELLIFPNTDVNSQLQMPKFDSIILVTLWEALLSNFDRLRTRICSNYHNTM